MRLRDEAIETQAQKEGAMSYTSCPACSSRKSSVVSGQIRRCSKCAAIFGTCYLGESYEMVRPFMTDADPQMERSRYFDFECLGSQGITRRHGWYDPETRLVTQVG